MAFVIESSIAVTECIAALTTAVANGSRVLFSIISPDDLFAQVSFWITFVTVSAFATAIANCISNGHKHHEFV